MSPANLRTVIASTSALMSYRFANKPPCCGRPLSANAPSRKKSLRWWLLTIGGKVPPRAYRFFRPRNVLRYQLAKKTVCWREARSRFVYWREARSRLDSTVYSKSLPVTNLFPSPAHPRLPKLLDGFTVVPAPLVKTEVESCRLQPTCCQIDMECCQPALLPHNSRTVRVLQVFPLLLCQPPFSSSPIRVTSPVVNSDRPLPIAIRGVVNLNASVVNLYCGVVDSYSSVVNLNGDSVNSCTVRRLSISRAGLLLRIRRLSI